MKRITTIIITALAVFVLAGCSKDGGNDDLDASLGPKRDNYVNGYIKPVKLFLLDGLNNYQNERKDVAHLLPVFFIFVPCSCYEQYCKRAM